MAPVRTCLGCRERADRSLLVRVVARGGEVVVDVSATLPGRGAWVHPTSRCVDTAIARKAFGRALHSDGALGTAGILTAVERTTATEQQTRTIQSASHSERPDEQAD